jgi:hypothetical protein
MITLNFLGQLDEIPTQTNGIDCGFFMIMAIMHLVSFGELNNSDCPPILHIAANTMQKTRVILLTSLIMWCSNMAEANSKSQSDQAPGSSASTSAAAEPKRTPTKQISAVLRYVESKYCDACLINFRRVEPEIPEEPVPVASEHMPAVKV